MFKVLYLVIPVFILSGCMQIPSKSDVPENLSTLRTKVAAGITSRSEIAEMFGVPFIRDDNLRVEVYRVLEDSAFYYDVPPFPPIPIPGGLDEIIAYALIVYDEHSIVSNIDWGVFHSSDNFDENVRQSANLLAGGFFFESFEVKGVYTRTETLFARESDSRQSLQVAAPQGKCLLHIAPGEYEYKIILDDDVLASYPTESGIFFPTSKSVKDHGWFLGFISILISTGEHTLSIVTRDLNPGEFKRRFSCDSGEKLYVHPNIGKYKWSDGWTWGKPYRYQGEIIISDIVPEVFEGRRLILYHRDRWLAPD